MKYTVYDRLLKREVGQQPRKYSDIRSIYGDRKWVDDLDIVNELEGHNGCVNALRYATTLIIHRCHSLTLPAGRTLAASSPLAPTTIASTSTHTTPNHRRRSSISPPQSRQDISPISSP